MRDKETERRVVTSKLGKGDPPEGTTTDGDKRKKKDGSKQSSRSVCQQLQAPFAIVIVINGIKRGDSKQSHSQRFLKGACLWATRDRSQSE